MGVIIIPLHGGFFECAIHTLDLPVCAGMVHFCEAVFNLMFMAPPVKDMHPGVLIHGSVRKLNSVICEDGVDFVRDFLDKIAQKLSRFGLTVFFKKLYVDKLTCAINGHKKVEFSFLCGHFSTIDMKIPYGIRFELLLWFFVALDFCQSADVMPLKGSV